MKNTYKEKLFDDANKIYKFISQLQIFQKCAIHNISNFTYIIRSVIHIFIDMN